jgi:hypothetical protein
MLGLDWTAFNWIVLIGLDCTILDRSGLDWNCIGLDCSSSSSSSSFSSSVISCSSSSSISDSSSVKLG